MKERCVASSDYKPEMRRAEPIGPPKVNSACRFVSAPLLGNTY
ncbi:MAG: hypothetical protein WCI63_02470 [bacterium]